MFTLSPIGTMSGYNPQHDEKDGSCGLRPSVAIPSAAWVRNFWANPPRRKKPLKPTACQTIPLMPLGFRMWRHIRSVRGTGKDVFMDPFNDWQHDTTHGVPLGGIGCGAMGRGWRGEFRRYSTGKVPSGLVYITDDTPHTGFTICASSADETSGCMLLPKPSNSQTKNVRYLSADTKAQSHQLYPRAWHVYDTPTKMSTTSPQYLATCEQISPVIANNYKDSSLPTSAFEWTIENLSDQEIEVSIMFTVHNGTTLSQQLKGGEHTAPVSEAACVHMAHPIEGHPGSYALAAEGVVGEYTTGAPQVSTCAEWPAESFDTLYSEFLARKGKLPRKQTRQSGPSLGSKGGLGAVAARVKIPPKKTAKMCFSLSWDFPIVNFGASPRSYHLKYTEWYGRDGKASVALALLALRERGTWRDKIASWQQPVLDNPATPEWYKALLFNETYFLTSGGSLWTVDGGIHPSKDPAKDHVGHWLYLEGMEYRMHNTYDVHFYASFALAMLFPLLEKSVTRDIADCVLLEWTDTRTFLHSGTTGIRKAQHCVPHDVGGPTEEPWGKPNIYNIHDTSRWKDLPLKFVLMVYRDYIALGKDLEFLASMYEAIKKVLHVCRNSFDPEGCGMIQNEPWPDQTYDAWEAKGVTAYCGGLWLAALRVAEQAALLLKKNDDHEEFKKCLVRAQSVYSELWNPKGYYNYDSSKTSHSNSIMADQCCGEWYIKACGLPSVLPDGQAKTALKTVYTYNVKKFGWKAHQGDKGPKLRGAVNGMRPDGALDTSSMQSMECWTGTTFAVASHMLMEGLTGEGFDTAKGIYEGAYNMFGFWFSTPEAWLCDGSFRSLGYMRPLSVWSVQWGISLHERL
eukprot:TRINITY_DN1849_c0_g1_i2.p1 TRINITY_DN1849_c0_g1~~TRINITY_DN1849_c0_g1_i2.p1  ORF type:complete len:853 (+),score=98.55 TRINITY_DN1849_c0_g1_i2:1744-4302(+)